MRVDIENAIDLIAQLIAFETTPDKPTLPVLEFIAAYFDKAGVTYQIAKTKRDGHGVLLGRMGPKASGGVLFSGHLDVVPVQGQAWETNPFEVHRTESRLYGRGTCDMKGFIGCVLSMIPVWSEMTLTHPLYFGFTTDEETDVETINDLITLIDPTDKPAIAVLGEPTDMQIVDCHKGVHDLCVHIRGIAAHSSRPDLGVNAIEVAHDIVSFARERAEQLKTTTRADHFTPPYATLGIVKISGGSAVNIIPDESSLYWHFRQVLNQQTTDNTAALNTHINTVVLPHHPGAQVNVTESLFMPALERRANNPAVKAVTAALPGHSIVTAPFCTEAGYFQTAGIDVVVCGPGSIEQAHKPNEFVDIAQLEQCLHLLHTLGQTARV